MENEIRLSIVTPTSGRGTLERAIDSIAKAGFSDTSDELIVVGDGKQPNARKIVSRFMADHSVFYLETLPTRVVGNYQRDVAISIATGTHLLFVDDDDVSTPGAFDLIRAVAKENRDRIIIFKAKAGARHGWSELWRIPRASQGNVSGQMFLIPRVRERLGSWGNRYEGDFDFISETIRKWPGGEESVVWREEVIAYLD